MVPAPTMVVRIDGAARAKAAIQALQEALGDRRVVQSVGAELALEGKRLVSDLTPRQQNVRERRGSTRRYGKPLYRGWFIQVEEGVAQAVFEATIRNRAVDTPAGTLVLGAVEHGAGRHDMFGVFGWFEGTNVLRSRSVHLSGRRIDLPGGRATELQTGKTVDVRFALQREAGWVNVGGEKGPGHINHPGSPAHHMVQHTKDQLAAVLDAFEQKLVKEYHDIFELAGGIS